MKEIRREENIPNSLEYSVGKSISFGAIGGFVAGLVMAPFLMITAMMAGMPADTMPTAMGLAFGAGKDNAMMVGFGMHMLTSVLIGVIFGAVTSIKKLRIRGFAKGIAEGIIAGMVAFAVIFIPVSMMMMPPVLVGMVKQMNPAMGESQIMGMLQQNMPLMFGMGIVEHLVYGVVLGAVVSALIIKTRPTTK
ncbi:MAG: hypothetical protein M3M88_02035 [Thermoproteota archaeon]|nr:hypothetical protein [Thermoproteota archaeon]